VLADGIGKPLPDFLVLARVADLPDDARVEPQPHPRLPVRGLGSSCIGSMSSPPAAEPTAQPERRYEGRHPSAVLSRHVFAVDVEACVHCKGRLRLIELCVTPEALDRSLHHAGPGPPPRAPPPSPRPNPTQIGLPLHAT